MTQKHNAAGTSTNAGETPLYTALVARFGDAQVTRQRLDVGDVVLTSAEGVSVIVERKTYADWGKSLTDGRYAEHGDTRTVCRRRT